MKIGVIGRGFVGNAVFEGLEFIENEMSFYDPKFPESKFEDILGTDCVFVCVPTNPNDDGTCDISIVRETIKKLKEKNYKGVIAIKSTVTPGTTQKLIDEFHNDKIVFVPEFLRERCAFTDFLDNHDVCIIGTMNCVAFGIVKQAHRSIPNKFFQMSPTEAELSKYFNNVYNACKITFANGFYEVCQALGANYQNIYDAMKLRKNIDGIYLRCGKKLRGFGGYCLPKDTLAFVKLIDNLNLKTKPKLFKSILDDNKKYKTTVWQGMRTEENIFGKKVCEDGECEEKE